MMGALTRFAPKEWSLFEDRFDVVVIGGGPAGATAAAVLVRAGHSVLVVEKHHYPRFHIGESLIPGVVALLDELGVGGAIHAEGFVPKYAAEFVTPDSKFRQRYVFSESLTPEHGLAYQVERARFDQILLDHARSKGATVRVGSEVTDFDEQPERVVCSVVDGDGNTRRVTSKFLIDANTFLSVARANKDQELSPRLPGRREAAARLLARSSST